MPSHLNSNTTRPSAFDYGANLPSQPTENRVLKANHKTPAARYNIKPSAVNIFKEITIVQGLSSSIDIGDRIL
ncbi:hypothetical protein HYQ46_009815 [Verticillium longisporum]|nr:hypothetical protein HYQ44_002169 [Verticillium longisporum]KAG7130833.1 hypothetical protein HYQ46_009815 [Verticillium longisporum]